MLDIPEVEGVDMPKPHEFLSAEQRDGSTLQAEEIYTETWEWLKKVGCAAKVSPQLLERYAMCSARWIQREEMTNREVDAIVRRIAGDLHTDYVEVPQDGHLAGNQADGIRRGDNGIFKGMPVTEEQKVLCEVAKSVYHTYHSDGKYIIDETRLILCQSHAPVAKLRKRYPGAEVNPLGDWTGGMDVDSGATNRKLGSDMADSVTGGGLHGKDLSKADVSVNIYAWLKAQETGKPVQLACAIGDDTVDGILYREIPQFSLRTPIMPVFPF